MVVCDCLVAHRLVYWGGKNVLAVSVALLPTSKVLANVMSAHSMSE